MFFYEADKLFIHEFFQCLRETCLTVSPLQFENDISSSLLYNYCSNKSKKLLAVLGIIIMPIDRDVL